MSSLDEAETVISFPVYKADLVHLVSRDDAELLKFGLKLQNEVGEILNNIPQDAHLERSTTNLTNKGLYAAYKKGNTPGTPACNEYVDSFVDHHLKKFFS